MVVAKNVPKYLALGTHFNTILDFDLCKKQNNIFFCSISREYRSFNETDTCIGSVLSQRVSVYDRCEFEIVKAMQDKFINIEGKYFYSVNSSITLEIFCVESLKNAQVTLTGIGSLIIKKDCYAKKKSLLLKGTNTYTLKDVVEVSRSNTSLDFNFDNLNFSKVENFHFNVFNQSFNTNLLQVNYDEFQTHIITLYTGMSFFIIIICVLILLIIRIYYKFKLPKINKSDNDIPKPALALAKESRKRKLTE